MCRIHGFGILHVPGYSTGNGQDNLLFPWEKSDVDIYIELSNYLLVVYGEPEAPQENGQTVTLEENQSWTYPQMQELLAHVKIEGLAEYDIRAAVAAAVALLIGAACVVIRMHKRRKQRQERKT